jgi:hypothetical protein
MVGEIMGDCGWFVVDYERFLRNKGARENRGRKRMGGEGLEKTERKRMGLEKTKERKRGRGRRKMGKGDILGVVRKINK